MQLSAHYDRGTVSATAAQLVSIPGWPEVQSTIECGFRNPLGASIHSIYLVAACLPIDLVRLRA